MNRRERVKKSIAREKSDITPYKLADTETVCRKLKAHFSDDSELSFLNALR